MQPNLLDLPEPRVKKRGRVTRTSVAAYRERPRDGRIAEVVTLLETYSHGPSTSAELAARAWCHYAISTGVVDLARGKAPSVPADVPLAFTLTIRRGLSDALALGLVEHAGTRRCAVSGRTCVTWQTRSR